MNTIHNVIVVAGGKGLRMGSELPKQFIPIGGKPVLMHTLVAFYNYRQDMKIILVLPDSHQQYWQSICAEYKFTIPHIIAFGGDTRFQSVKNGLEYVTEGLVGIHDAVRPFVSQALIANAFLSAKVKKAVIPAIFATDSLREMEENGSSKIINRNKIILIQTPQVFDAETLKKAYEAKYDQSYTDDASVVEASGVSITIVGGERTNIKITTPIDLKIAEVILDEKIE